MPKSGDGEKTISIIMIIIKRQPASAHTQSEWTQKQHVAAPPLTVQLRTSELNAIRASWHNVKRERERERLASASWAEPWQLENREDFSKWRCQTRAGRLAPALRTLTQPIDGEQQVISINGSRRKRVKLVPFSSIERSLCQRNLLS